MFFSFLSSLAVAQMVLVERQRKGGGMEGLVGGHQCSVSTQESWAY